MLLYREHRSHWWTYFLSDPHSDTGEVDGYVDDSQYVADLMRDWSVEWLSPEEDQRIEREIFGMRDQIRTTNRRAKSRRKVGRSLFGDSPLVMANPSDTSAAATGS